MEKFNVKGKATNLLIYYIKYWLLHDKIFKEEQVKYYFILIFDVILILQNQM